ncbi:MAG TPA: HK97 family phage prohead protease [Terriglobales bacterium]|nr:HK97 family phage prohead protease [Terriglobales bacterium]
MEKPERRSVVEFRLSKGEGGAPTKLAGYAARFNSLSNLIGGKFRERIAPGAFRSALASGDDVLALLEHDMRTVLGRRSSGTLRLHEDEQGLAFELDLPDTQAARDLQVLIERRDITGMSFGFLTAAGGDVWHREGGELVRTLREVRRLVDVSPVAAPAYPDTEVALRSLQEWETRAKNAAGEMSFEEMYAALRQALRELLGSPWDDPGWMIVATFAASVVVQRGHKFSNYPVTWGKDGKPTLGDPADVEQVYRSEHGQDLERRRRLQVAEAEVSLGGGPLGA